VVLKTPTTRSAGCSAAMSRAASRRASRIASAMARAAHAHVRGEAGR
jgi:hypothetical protein